MRLWWSALNEDETAIGRWLTASAASLPGYDRCVITANFSRVCDGPWLHMTPVAVGKRDPVGGPDEYVLVEDDRVPTLRIDLYAPPEPEAYVFQAATVWHESVVIGWGSRVFVVPLGGGPTHTIELNTYFVSVTHIGGAMIVASGQRLYRIGPSGDVVWRTEVVGIDGVVVVGLVAGWIHAEGEWDPPGGWRRVRVDLASGSVDALPE